MNMLGFDEARFDKMGNVVGRIGHGEKVIVFDSHIDTVGIGDESVWQWDPFKGKIENGNLYARGAVDEKGSTPGMIYGMAFARDLGLLEGWTPIISATWKSGVTGSHPTPLLRLTPR
jgi:acetylornithine deacetylase/succinyl-diaminopimelate desuccinylase-like protein